MTPRKAFLSECKDVIQLLSQELNRTAHDRDNALENVNSLQHSNDRLRNECDELKLKLNMETIHSQQSIQDTLIQKDNLILQLKTQKQHSTQLQGQLQRCNQTNQSLEQTHKALLERHSQLGHRFAQLQQAKVADEETIRHLRLQHAQQAQQFTSISQSMKRKLKQTLNTRVPLQSLNQNHFRSASPFHRSQQCVEIAAFDPQSDSQTQQNVQQIKRIVSLRNRTSGNPQVKSQLKKLRETIDRQCIKVELQRQQGLQRSVESTIDQIDKRLREMSRLTK